LAAAAVVVVAAGAVTAGGVTVAAASLGDGRLCERGICRDVERGGAFGAAVWLVAVTFVTAAAARAAAAFVVRTGICGDLITGDDIVRLVGGDVGAELMLVCSTLLLTCA